MVAGQSHDDVRNVACGEGKRCVPGCELVMAMASVDSDERVR